MRLKNICWWRRIYFKQHLKSHIFHFLESKLTVHRHIRASQAFVWSFQPLSDVSAALSLRLWFYWYLLFSICSVETCAWVSHSNSCFPSESFMKPTEPHEKNNKSDQSLLILHKKKVSAVETTAGSHKLLIILNTLRCVYLSVIDYIIHSIYIQYNVSVLALQT